MNPSYPPILQAIVYSREGCHLCEDAVQLLRQRGLTVQEIDIDQDPALAQRYDTCVPVVVIEGRERFRGRVNEALLDRLLRAGRRT